MCFLVAVCNCAVHKKCHDKILGKCTGTAKDSRETKVKYHVIYVAVLVGLKACIFMSYVLCSTESTIAVFWIIVSEPSELSTRLYTICRYAVRFCVCICWGTIFFCSKTRIGEKIFSLDCETQQLFTWPSSPTTRLIYYFPTSTTHRLSYTTDQN